VRERTRGRPNSSLVACAAQRYDLANFLGFFATGGVVQQCNDNSNLEAILLHAIGVPLDPMFITSDPSVFAHPQGPGLVPTGPYYAPGGTVTRMDQFAFHQFCSAGGTVHHPAVDIRQEFRIM